MAAAPAHRELTSVGLSLWEGFKTEHDKVYADEEEHTSRREIFLQTLEEIEAKNAALIEMGEDAIHGITRFADWTREEFEELLMEGMYDLFGDITDDTPVLETGMNVTASEGAFSWVDLGMTTAVKDQAQCGSCWAFSSVSTIESAWARAGNPLTEFSPQQLVSCDTVDAGCNGGIPTDAFQYVKEAGGLATEEDFPYTSQDGDSGTCPKEGLKLTGGTVSEYGYATKPCQGIIGSLFCSEDSDAIAAALQENGPISIAIDASEWNTYTGGIMTSASCSSNPRKMDHAVQTVGYNAEGDVPYWIVRNSWTDKWGEGGYIYLKMGENTCGIANLGAQVTAV